MNTKLVEAFRFHQAGDLDRAEECYRSLLGDESLAVHVHQLLGTLLLQKKQPIDAIPYLELAAKVAPDSAIILNNLAIAYTRCQRSDEAVAVYLRSVAVDPNNVETRKNLAEVYMEQQEFLLAVDVLAKAIELNPTSTSLWLKYAMTLYRLNCDDEAKLCFEQVLGQEPENFKALLGLGRVLLRQPTKSEDAVRVWKKLTEMEPSDPLILNNYGSVLTSVKRDSEAEQIFRKVLENVPEFLPAICNLGIVLASLGRYEEARDCFLKATLREPNGFKGNSDEEQSNWKKYGCIAYSQLSTVENLLGRTAEAEAAVERALAIDSDDADSHVIRSFLLLQRGDYADGWKEHEWRKKTRMRPRDFPVPEWLGEVDPGQTLLVHSEQGLGDTIQFVRYVKLVKKRVGRVIVLTYRPLSKLFQDIQEIDEVVTDVDQLPNYDRHIAMMSLPHVLQTTQLSDHIQVPYLHATPDLVGLWRSRMETLSGFRVGIVWQGNREYSLDRDRSIPLSWFKSLAEIPGVQLVSLQKGDGCEQLKSVDFQVSSFHDVDESSGPFMDTAAMMTLLDLVIAPNTALVHLAGALGRPTWLLKSSNADWRWPLVEPNPWYPTISVMRQPVRGDWESVFARMAKELPHLVSMKATKNGGIPI